MISPKSAPINADLSAASQRSAYRDELDQKYGVKPLKPIPPLKEATEYAELEAIDFGKYKEGPDPEAIEARKTLARQLDKSLSTHGFFFITNHGISQETIDRLNSISEALNSIEDSEKLKYLSGGMTSDEDTNTTGAERGAGFKPRKYWGMPNGVRDNIEFYNLVNIVQDYELENDHHPELIRVYLNEIANFFRYIHNSVLYRFTILCDIILELPEGTLWEKHFKVVQGNPDASGGGFGRLMSYFALTEEENRLTENTWLRGHSDAAGLTFIASQPMVTLQILDYATHTWKYVKHVPGALVVNIGDGIEFLTGGYFRSTVHRVVQPFPSQRGYTRQSLIYFSKPSPETIIDPETINSPYLKRLGINKPDEWEKICFEDWDTEKDRLFGKSKVNKGPNGEPLPTVIHGRYAERWIRQPQTKEATA